MKAKLAIWDLDDTLWSGTLAENGEIVLFEERANIIKRLNERGVVNSICSKNDLPAAKAALERLGLWDCFVFPEIAFLPKGEMVKAIISDMQLRAPDVLFIDDNPVNLREVSFVNPGIQLLDASESTTNQVLDAWVASLSDVKKSRVDEYRQLERKRKDMRSSSQSNEEFLATCGIKIARVRRTDNLPFADRIEELINRTNQMNFLKTRVEPNTMAEYVGLPGNEPASYFVWDKYGFYGLVGFSAVEKGVLKHLTYSCRIMNMGVEHAVAGLLLEEFPTVKIPHEVARAPWIRFVDPDSKEFKTLLAKEVIRSDEITIRVMANCQSGAIAHYMGLQGVEWDNWPRVFKLEEMLTSPEKLNIRPWMVYGAFNDYDDRYWQVPPNAERYLSAVQKLVDRVVHGGGRLQVILPPEKFTVAHPYGVTTERFAAFNHIWRELSLDAPKSIRVIEAADLLPEVINDPRHFPPATLRQIASMVRAWMQSIEEGAAV